jgi:hypothetical protein
LIIQLRRAVVVFVKKVVLDVLKPHQPNILQLSKSICATGVDYSVRIVVLEVDEQTETLQLEVSGGSINFEAICASITEQGGSIHSIDEVMTQSADESCKH